MKGISSKGFPACYGNSKPNIQKLSSCSIFPEKLIFGGGEYRTAQVNPFVSLLCNTGEGFSQKAKGQEVIFNDLSSLAPPPGLEPGTPRLTVLCSNQLS